MDIAPLVFKAKFSYSYDNKSVKIYSKLSDLKFPRPGLIVIFCVWLITRNINRNLEVFIASIRIIP